ncbi:12348_t:CDS:2, partial [Gigaspora margarita]
MSSTMSPTNTSPKFNDSIILVLEPTNDTFSIKEFFFPTTLREFSITWPFVNGKHISVEDKEGVPVEPKNFDLLEFGIDIYNEHDCKLMFRKIAVTAQIISSRKSQIYEKKIQLLEENLKTTWTKDLESDSKQIEELK